MRTLDYLFFNVATLSHYYHGQLIGQSPRHSWSNNEVSRSSKISLSSLLHPNLSLKSISTETHIVFPSRMVIGQDRPASVPPSTQQWQRLELAALQHRSDSSAVGDAEKDRC